MPRFGVSPPPPPASLPKKHTTKPACAKHNLPPSLYHAPRPSASMAESYLQMPGSGSGRILDLTLYEYYIRLG